MTAQSPDHRFLEVAPDAILLVDDDGIITFANPQATVLFGHSEGPPDAELVGRSVDSLVPERFRGGHGGHRSGYVQTPQTRRMGTAESRLLALRADGSEFPCEIGLSRVDADRGSVTMVIVRDISTRLAASRESQMIRSSLDAVSDAVFLFDDSTLANSYANRGAARQTGRTPAELTDGLTPLDLLPDLTHGEFLALLAPLRTGSSEIVTITTAFRCPDGTGTPVEISLQYPPEAAADDHRYFVAIARDLTNRRDAERLLRASEAGFRSAFNDAPVGMVITDPTGDHPVIVEANRAFCDLLGRDATDIVGRRVDELTHPDDRNALAQRRAWFGPGDANVEKRFLHRSGAAVWCIENAADLTSGPGQRRRLAHVIDISRRVEAEVERDRREELLLVLGEIRRHLLDELGVSDSLAEICAVSRRLVDAQQAFVLVPRGEHYELAAVTDANVDGYPHGEPIDSALADQILLGGRTVALDQVDLPDESVPFAVDPGLFIGTPLVTRDGVEGVMVVAGVAADDVAHARRTIEALASEAALAIQLARSRRERRRLSVVEDRDRIARDLHDVVIQRLFAAGMRLQSSAASGANLEARAVDTVNELDATIGVIRETIFRLTSSEPDLYDEIATMVHGFRTVGGDPIELTIDGDSSAVPEPVAEQLLPSLNELVSNAVRHGEAGAIGVTLTVGDEVVLVVADDGVGFGPSAGRGFGLGNIGARARNLGGRLDIDSVPNHGTTVTWRVPLSAPVKS